MATRPSYQWYPGDAQRDIALRSCCLEARGLWREMLDLMHEGEPYGFLTAGGVPIGDAKLASLVGITAKRCSVLLWELEERGVFSRTEEGVIYSRRMVRDERLRTIRAQSGRLGGNPNLVNQQDNHPDNHQSKQTSTPSSSSSTSTTKTTASAAKAPRVTWLTPIKVAWEESKGAGSFRAPKAAGLLDGLKQAGHTAEEIATRLRTYLKRLDDPKFASLARFAETFADHVPLKLAGPPIVDGWLSPELDRLTAPPGMVA